LANHRKNKLLSNGWGETDVPVVFAKDLLALLAGKDHLVHLLQLVIGLLRVAFRAIEPLLAARGANGDLGVQNVLAHDDVFCIVLFFPPPSRMFSALVGCVITQALSMDLFFRRRQDKKAGGGVDKIGFGANALSLRCGLCQEKGRTGLDGWCVLFVLTSSWCC
jgi:hypothetical protein